MSAKARKANTVTQGEPSKQQNRVADVWKYIKEQSGGRKLRTISVPAALHTDMQELKHINWSRVASDAFKAVVDAIKSNSVS